MPDQAPPTDATDAPPPMPKGVLALFGVSVGALAISLVAWWVLARPPSPYPSSNPDEMLDSMAALVQKGDAGRLVEHIELAPPGATDEQRARYKDLAIRVGRVLERAQTLADTVQRAFPDDIAQIKAEIEAGETPGLLAELAKAARQQGGSFSVGPGGQGAPPNSRDELSAMVGVFLSDPFAAIEKGRERLSTMELDDDTAMLEWDAQPILPPFGLIARRGDDDRWRIVAPTSLPMVSRAMPKNESEFQIWGSLLATAENLLEDLNDRVESGRINSVQGLARAAVREAVVPMGMVMVAYSQAVRDRDRDAEP